MKCPHCKKEFTDAGRAKGGRAAWASLSKAERSRRMKAVRSQALVKNKETA